MYGKAQHQPKPSHLSTRSLAALPTSSQTQASLLPKTAKPGIEISSRERRPTASQGPKTSEHKRALRNPAGQAKCKHHPPKRTNERKNPGPNRGAGHPTQQKRDGTTRHNFEDTRRCSPSEPEGFKTAWTPKVQTHFCPKAFLRIRTRGRRTSKASKSTHNSGTLRGSLHFFFL